MAAGLPSSRCRRFIAYMHRLLGVSIGLILIGIALYAFRHRDDLEFRARRLARPAYIVLALVVVQGLLGAITVWLELPTGVIVVHFMTALTIMALLLDAAFRAGTLGYATPSGDGIRSRKAAASALAALVLGFILITFGALTANTPGAPQACQGFPRGGRAGSIVPARKPQGPAPGSRRGGMGRTRGLGAVRTRIARGASRIGLTT